MAGAAPASLSSQRFSFSSSFLAVYIFSRIGVVNLGIDFLTTAHSDASMLRQGWIAILESAPLLLLGQANGRLEGYYQCSHDGLVARWLRLCALPGATDSFTDTLHPWTCHQGKHVPSQEYHLHMLIRGVPRSASLDLHYNTALRCRSYPAIASTAPLRDLRPDSRACVRHGRRVTASTTGAWTALRYLAK
jgi:hypothetical protein